MAELKPTEVIMRIDFSASNGVEVVAHAEKVQELVRCKECKYYCEAERMCNDTNGFDRYWKPTDYCSYGERREDAEQ